MRHPVRAFYTSFYFILAWTSIISFYVVERQVSGDLPKVSKHRKWVDSWILTPSAFEGDFWREVPETHGINHSYPCLEYPGAFCFCSLLQSQSQQTFRGGLYWSSAQSVRHDSLVKGGDAFRWGLDTTVSGTNHLVRKLLPFHFPSNHFIKGKLSLWC